MCCDQCDVQWVVFGIVGQYYDDEWCVGFFCEIFGVVGEMYFGIVDDVFVYWCCDYCGEFIGLVVSQSLVEQGENIGVVGGVE